MKRWIFALLTIVVPTAAAATVQETDCGFRLRGATLSCGYLEVPENRAQPDGKRVPIHFVRAHATGDSVAKDPIFLLGGGPGMNATPNAWGVLNRMRDLLKQRDLVVIDQRGTGRSNPLDCFAYDDVTAEDVEQIFEGQFFDPAQYQSCRERLSKENDLSQYTTTASAADVDAVAAALGYETINLHGGSYGTRWALEIMRRHPERVRAAVLIGVAPPGELLLARLATDFDQNMQRLLADCAEDKACSTEYPKLNDQLAALLKRVEKAAEKTTVRFNGKDLPVEVDYEMLVTTLRFQMYSVFSAATLPRQIAAAAEGDLSGIANSALQTTLQLHNLVAEGLWASVICSEEAPYIETESATRRAAKTMMGDRRVLSTQLICEDWPRSAIPEDFNRPVQADHPVLLLAGEWDVASPPDLGAKAAETLPNGKFVEVKARSHWGISGSCVDGLVRQFVEQGSVADLDACCATKFERPPFVSR